MKERKLPSAEEIEQRAYEIYLERGCEEGRSMEDWLVAEKELAELLEEPVSSRSKARAART